MTAKKNMELALLLERHMTVCIAMVIVGYLDVNERKTKYNSPKINLEDSFVKRKFQLKQELQLTFREFVDNQPTSRDSYLFQG